MNEARAPAGGAERLPHVQRRRLALRDGDFAAGVPHAAAGCMDRGDDRDRRTAEIDAEQADALAGEPEVGPARHMHL